MKELRGSSLEERWGQLFPTPNIFEYALNAFSKMQISFGHFILKEKLKSMMYVVLF